MAKIKLNGDTSGYIEISAPAVSGNNTLELGPGTKILTNLDNTFTGVSTFTSGLHVTGGNLGIGTDNPALRAHIYSTAATDAALIESTQNYATLRFKSALNTSGPTIGIDGAGGLQLDQKDTSKYISFAIGSERLRIDSSGRLMLGQTSAYSATGTGTMMLTVTKNASNRTDVAISNQFNGDNASAAIVLATHGQDYILEATGSGNTTDGTRAFRILKGSDERLRIGSDGHLSYKNSSPPAWSTDSGYANATLGSSAYFRTDTDVNSNFFTLGSNAYRGSSNWQHVNSGWATQLQQSANDGDLSYRSSSTSGSAGGTITWVEHFRVKSNGDVLIADTTNSIYDDSTGGGMNLKANGQLILKKQAVSTADPLMWLNDTGQTTNKFILFAQDGTEKASIGLAGDDLRFARNGYNETLRITSSGEVLISNSTNRFLSLDRTNASSGSGEFNLNVESNSQATVSYDDGAQIVIGTSSSPRTQAGFSEKVRISSQGYVTTPSQPSFFSRPPGNYNLSSGGNSPIGGTWSNVHNIGSHFSNGTFTAPVAGTYQFSWSVFVQSETVRLDAYILVNGTNVMREEINGYPNTAANKNGSVHGCYYLSANDNVTFGVYSAAGTNIYVQAHPWTYACGFLVG